MTDEKIATGGESPASIVEATQRWIERAVIGLGLCPFAKPVYLSKRIRYNVSEQHSIVALLDELADELQLLNASDATQIETTLLIHPYVLQDFLDYNDFLDEVDRLLEELQLNDDIQVASFHPQYQFAETAPEDVENFTNRSPYPMLHLLRESSVTRAISEHPDVDQIPQRNIQTLRSLGHEGWRRLWIDRTADL